MPDPAPSTALSPLAEIPPFRGPVGLTERNGLGALSLRGSGADFLSTVAATLQLSLPVRPNRTTARSGLLALWLGPDEWMLQTPIERVTAYATALRDALAQHHAAVVDVSDRSAVLRLSGPHSRHVLASGCPLDLHHRAFSPGHCARSLYLKTAILIHQVDNEPTYDIQVQRSVAEYLWNALVQSALEFQADRT